MHSKHLYTIRWTQPYATNSLRPYLRALQEQMELLIEQVLDNQDSYPEADQAIKRIMDL
jgi:hypothetical protein